MPVVSTTFPSPVRLPCLPLPPPRALISLHAPPLPPSPQVPAPSRALIYLHDHVPIVVDTSGKGDIFPTVFALWRAPKTLPQVFVKHPFVTQVRCEIAPGMSQGHACIQTSPGIGDTSCICSYSGPRSKPAAQTPCAVAPPPLQYLVNGADLMLPGVDASSGLPAFSKGDLLAVCVRGNPVRGTQSVECLEAAKCGC